MCVNGKGKGITTVTLKSMDGVMIRCYSDQPVITKAHLPGCYGFFKYRCVLSKIVSLVSCFSGWLVINLSATSATHAGLEGFPLKGTGVSVSTKMSLGSMAKAIFKASSEKSMEGPTETKMPSSLVRLKSFRECANQVWARVSSFKFL